MFNEIAKEIRDYILYKGKEEDDENTVKHYGTKRHSGRYKWGSGENPYQHEEFMNRLRQYEAQGLNEKEIADKFGVSTTEFRMAKRYHTHVDRKELYSQARKLRDDGVSYPKIAQALGMPNESSVRSLLNEETSIAKNKGMATAEVLKKIADEKGMVEIGLGTETQLNVTRNTLDEASYIADMDGYRVYNVTVPNATNKGKRVSLTVLAKPGITYEDVVKNRGEIQPLVDQVHTEDGGQTWNNYVYPASLDSKRVMIRYGDDGGKAKDGVIEIRRGTKDLDLDGANYAQVRILVDGTHYMKGMAVYSDGSDMPEGVDVIYNSNKSSDVDKFDVLKSVDKNLKKDPNNPFGAVVKAQGQHNYIGDDGKEHLSPINKLKEENDWEDYSKNLSSQFLSKQSLPLIKRQLNMTYANAESDFEDIMSLENPTVRKERLIEFADELDSAAVHLKAAALPRQSTKVILPVDSLKDNEVYAPSYGPGEELALVRYPHAGTFEIPIVKNNLKNNEGKTVVGAGAIDAIGINSAVAARLSGADFDGDTVIAIPISDKVKIKSTRPLQGLVGFETSSYEYSSADVDKWSTMDKIKQLRKNGKTDAEIGKEMNLGTEKDVRKAFQEGRKIKILEESNKGREMGMVSNLITDMTLAGADEDELARAVRHSMVVIDAPKHKLDYKKSFEENRIDELKKKYQKHLDENGNEKYGGASTLISMHKSTELVPERQGSQHVDDEGKVWFNESHRMYVDKKGNLVEAKTSVPRILQVDDVRQLSSGTPQENAYADYANKIKALATRARQEYRKTGEIKKDKAAEEKYAEEVNSINAKIRISKANLPAERHAQILANDEVRKAILTANEDGIKLSQKEIGKIAALAINNARAKAGSRGKDVRFAVTDKEWEAIQAGAVSPNVLKDVLRFANKDRITELAMPKRSPTLSSAKLAKAKSMAASGYAISEIADALGYSPSTIYRHLHPKED